MSFLHLPLIPCTVFLLDNVFGICLHIHQYTWNDRNIETKPGHLLPDVDAAGSLSSWLRGLWDIPAAGSSLVFSLLPPASERDTNVLRALVWGREMGQGRDPILRKMADFLPAFNTCPKTPWSLLSCPGGRWTLTKIPKTVSSEGKDESIADLSVVSENHLTIIRIISIIIIAKQDHWWHTGHQINRKLKRLFFKPVITLKFMWACPFSVNLLPLRRERVT